jgi:integrase
VLDYAAARGWRTGENPARWRGHVENLLASRTKVAKVEHHPALPWKEIGAFMAALGKREAGSVAAMALRFAILTAARSGEVLGARWQEIDMEQAAWTIPGDRMKAGKLHRVPLTAAALDVLRRAADLRTTKSPTAYVFPGHRAGSSLSVTALRAVLHRMGRDDLTVHGFRSTFRDWTAESTSYPREVAEAALAHALRDKTEAAYARGDLFEKRRRVMADWAAFCARPAADVGQVVPIRAPEAATA